MKTELEKCLAGELFNGGDKVLADMTLNAKRLLKQLNETDYADTEQRKRIFHDLFGKMGEHVHIDIDFHCEYGKHIFIGDQVICGSTLFFAAGIAAVPFSGRPPITQIRPLCCVISAAPIPQKIPHDMQKQGRMSRFEFVERFVRLRSDPPSYNLSVTASPCHLPY